MKGRKNWGHRADACKRRLGSSTRDREAQAHLGGYPPGFLHGAHSKGIVRMYVKYGSDWRRKKSSPGRKRFKKGSHRAFGAMRP